MNRIGMMGGSFDPVHQGHLMVAAAACEELDLDRLFFIPAARSPFKPDRQPAPDQERLRLLRLALAGQPHYEIDDQEIQRGGTSFTIDTARNYASRFQSAELFYLIGADHILLLPKWKEAENLAQLVQFAVIPRPGDGQTSLPQPFRFTHLKGFPVSLSSSQIRRRIKEGLPIETLVPPPVAEAIRNNHLYL